MAMIERDERLLGILLTGAAKEQSPQRLRYDTVMSKVTPIPNP